MAILQSLGKLLGGAVHDVGQGLQTVNNIGAPHQVAPPSGGVVPSNQPQSAYWRLTVPPNGGPAIASTDATNYDGLGHLPVSQVEAPLLAHALLMQRFANIQRVLNTPQQAGRAYPPGIPFVAPSGQQPTAPLLSANTGGNILAPPVTSPLRGF